MRQPDILATDQFKEKESSQLEHEALNDVARESLRNNKKIHQLPIREALSQIEKRKNGGK